MVLVFMVLLLMNLLFMPLNQEHNANSPRRVSCWTKDLVGWDTSKDIVDGIWGWHLVCS